MKIKQTAQCNTHNNARRHVRCRATSCSNAIATSVGSAPIQTTTRLSQVQSNSNRLQGFAQTLASNSSGVSTVSEDGYMKTWIAERKLIAETVATGERKRFTIQIGMPFWLPNEDWACCPIELDGLFDRVADAKGIDLVQALNLASDVDLILKSLSAKYNFYWSSGEGYFDED